MRCVIPGFMVLALLTGCGGSDSEDDEAGRAAPRPAAAQPRNDDFVRRVDAVCRDANPKLRASTAALTRARDAARAGRASLPETFDTFATLLRRASATSERVAAQLRAIKAPPAEKAFHGALLDSIADGTRNLREQVRAAKARDATRLRELSVQGSVLNAKSKGLITGHGGFRFCGRA
jgi:hypothetical protein